MRGLAAALPLAVAVVLGLAGCGGGSSGSDATTTAARTTPRLGTGDTFGPRLDAHHVAGLGDSITAGSPLWDPDQAFREQFAASLGRSPDEQWEYWYERAHPGVTVDNCGVFGERVEEIEARLRACVGDAKTVVVQGGINDIAQGAGIAGALAHLRSMVGTLRSEGREVLLVEVLPWTNGWPQAAPQIDALNDQIRALGRSAGVRVLPWYGALEDPAAPGRMARRLTIDGDHPSVAGYRRLAALVPAP